MRQFKPGQLQTGSVYPITSSYAMTASYVAGISFNTSSLVTTASFNTYTSSQSLISASIDSQLKMITASINTLTSSYNSFTSSYTTGSFTGSFRGDGSGLINLPIPTIDTGSLVTTASFNTYTSSQSSVSASFNTRITNLETFSSSLDATFATDAQLNAATASLSASNAQLRNNFSIASASFDTRILNGSSSISSLSTSFNSFTASYTTGSFTGSFTGQLIGTASWAQNSVTASFVTASNVVGTVTSSSYAISASYLIGGITIDTGSLVTTASFNTFTSSIQGQVNSLTAATSSYTLNSVTASMLAPYVLTSQTASMTVLSASFATTSSYITASNVVGTVTSASYSATASYVLPLTQNVIITGSLNISGSTTQIGTNNLLGQTNLSGSIQISGSIYATANMSLGGVFRLDPANDPGYTNETASFLFTSASNTTQGYDLYYRQDGNLVKFKWLEGGISSGLLYGGVISASGSTIYVSSGSGIILNTNATLNKEINPIFTYVTWPNYSSSATHLTSSQNTYLYVDNLGVIHQQTEWFDQTQYEQSIPLGRVTHPNYSSITGIGSNVQTTYNSDTQQSDFIRAFGPLKVNGFSIQPHTGTLSFGFGGGTAYTLGGFYSQDPNSPSHYTSAGYATASIARAYRSGSGVRLDNNGGAFYTTIDPDFWDDGTGTLNTMSSGAWQIQRVFANPVTGRVVVYYGQNTYTTLINALQYLATDSFIEGEFTTHSLIFIGYLVLKGQTNNLTDTTNNRIINGGIFRNIAGGSSGGGAIAQTLDELGDVTITTPTNGQALIYSAGIWENGTPKIATTSSYITSSNVVGTVTSASYAVTASYVLQAVSSSFAQTASFVTASNVIGIVTSASSAVTASFLQGLNLGLYTTTASFNTFTASYTTGSFTGSFTGTLTGTASWASNSVNSQTASFVTASNVIGTVVSASYALTASYAMNGGGNINTSSLVNPNQRASYYFCNDYGAMTTASPLNDYEMYTLMKMVKKTQKMYI
jgi:hypothetical protein